MSCLTHDKRFLSAFHNIINELRNENRTSLAILRTIPKKCCTCHEENPGIMEPVVMTEKNQFMKLTNLIERVNREKQTNPKLILSLNRFENLIEANRGPAPLLSESVPLQKQEKSNSSHDDSSSSSDSEDITPMETSKPPIGCQKNQIKKAPKPIRTGTFLFLPYASEGKKGRNYSNSLLDVAKTLQRSRFIGRHGHIALLEKEYDVRINLITSKTTQQVAEALENAKKGLDQLTIHNKNKSLAMSEKEEGEWVLIRSKKPQNQKQPVNIEQALDDLTSRWESALHISKRNNDDYGDSTRSVRRKR